MAAGHTAANHPSLGTVLASLMRSVVITKQKQNIETGMGRSILLWRLGVPIPTIVLLLLFGEKRR